MWNRWDTEVGLEWKRDAKAARQDGGRTMKIDDYLPLVGNIKANNEKPGIEEKG